MDYFKFASAVEKMILSDEFDKLTVASMLRQTYESISIVSPRFFYNFKTKIVDCYELDFTTIRHFLRTLQSCYSHTCKRDVAMLRLFNPVIAEFEFTVKRYNQSINETEITI